MTAQRLLTTAQAAEQLGKHRKTVMRMIHTGELKAIRENGHGPGARYKVHASSVTKWIRDHEYHPEI